MLGEQVSVVQRLLSLQLRGVVTQPTPGTHCDPLQRLFGSVGQTLVELRQAPIQCEKVWSANLFHTCGGIAHSYGAISIVGAFTAGLSITKAHSTPIGERTRELDLGPHLEVSTGVLPSLCIK